MTTPLPHYRVTETIGTLSTVEVDLPDFATLVLTMYTRLVGTPSGDLVIREAIARRAETQAHIRDGD